MTAREGMTAEILEDDSPEQIIIHRASSASLVIISLDGTASAEPVNRYETQTGRY